MFDMLKNREFSSVSVADQVLGKIQVTSGIWANASRCSQLLTCCNSRQGTLEVDKVGNRVLSYNTMSSFIQSSQAS